MGPVLFENEVQFHDEHILLYFHCRDINADIDENLKF